MLLYKYPKLMLLKQIQKTGDNQFLYLHFLLFRYLYKFVANIRIYISTVALFYRLFWRKGLFYYLVIVLHDQ